MTHTVTDAEDAIARHPESLEQLSMAADLLQELGDQRGEDFAACLAGVITAEEVMRRHPADVSAMFVAAWRIESDGQSCGKCDEYIGVGQVPSDPNAYNAKWITCPLCGGSGDDGSTARAEALRLLAECGKVGSIHPPDPNWYFYWSIVDADPHELISNEWWAAANALAKSYLEGDAVTARLDLLDAYAQADPDTRRRWAEEMRAMKPREEVTT